MAEVTRVTASAARWVHDARMRERLAWKGLRCCRMHLRERAPRWRRRQAQMRRH
jgi:hypothetical protein